MRAGLHPGGSWQPPGATTPHEPNRMGLLALGLAVVGTLLACVPVVRPLGWIFLVVALVLGTVAIFRKNMKTAIAFISVATALTGSGIAAIVGLLTVDNSFTTGFTEGVLAGAGIASEPASPDQGSDRSFSVREWTPPRSAATSGPGSRNGPIAVGETIEFSGWEVRVNAVNLDATEEVMAVSELVDPPQDGYRYALIDLTLKYTGEGTPYSHDIEVEFVTDSGNLIPGYSGAIKSPEPGLDPRVESGASSTGNLSIQVPEDEEGLLLFTARNDPDREVFVSVR